MTGLDVFVLMLIGIALFAAGAGIGVWLGSMDDD